ncbi:MAG TPA: STAS domain-containing protein [Myxococcales bacterium LLY-WYZ-16_1]|nr:STAS domain-containing protein [Myxococcales bacterium LLY-WYZ-16_1]
MFQFEFSDDGRQLVITIRDRKFDITTAPEFRQQIQAQWTGDIQNVAVDLSQVEFVDSSGIGALVSVHKRVADRGSAMTIRNACPAVISVIELLRLHRVFRLEPAGQN